MTTRSGPGIGRPDPSLSVITGERRHLTNLAYRMLGSLADAEDAVQEAYARWYALSREQREAIESPGGWLTTVASRICLDLLGSARARRELYVGEWLPEPLPAPAEQPGAAAGSVNPAASVISSAPFAPLASCAVRAELAFKSLIGFPYRWLGRLTSTTGQPRGTSGRVARLTFRRAVWSKLVRAAATEGADEHDEHAIRAGRR